MRDRVKEDKEKDGDDEKESAEETKIREEPASPVKPIAFIETRQPVPSHLRIYFHSVSDPRASALPKAKQDADASEDIGTRFIVRRLTRTGREGRQAQRSR